MIALGSRDNNELLDSLYRQGFVYTDSTYPGAGGFELRSLHNPTGGNFNVIIAGGSDDSGVNDAVKALLEELASKPKELGYLLKLRVPAYTGEVDGYNAENFNSRMISGIRWGYGWNYVAVQMALFYQTGDTKYAKEFLRLAFPTPPRSKFQVQHRNENPNPASSPILHGAPDDPPLGLIEGIRCSATKTGSKSPRLSPASSTTGESAS